MNNIFGTNYANTTMKINYACVERPTRSLETNWGMTKNNLGANTIKGATRCEINA